MKRKVCVVTGNRAEYGLLLPVLRAIEQSSHLTLSLAVTGTHLLPQYGNTVEVIMRDGFSFDSVPMYISKVEDKAVIGYALAKGVEGFTSLLDVIRPSFVLVLGDRLEPLAAVLASATLCVPIAHIHGGDTSDCGQIDDSIRHSISKFAHIHFAASKRSAERLEQMGEMGWRIHNVGSPALDNLLRSQFIDKGTLFTQLNLDPNRPTLICLQHSVIPEKDQAGNQMMETMNAIEELKIQSVVIYPNNDPGSSDIVSVIEFFSRVPHIRVFKNLKHLEFVSLMKHSSVLVGNSSSSVTESSSFQLPSISIGIRQSGREHAQNVIFVDHNKRDIVRAITKALYDSEFRNLVAECTNPYGDGHASDRIVEVLEKIPINVRLMKKLIAY